MSYTPGKAVWFELSTPEPEAAKRFYGEVFGWKTDTVPMPGGEYTMFKPGDDRPFNSGIVDPRGPVPHWVSYISVDDVDAVAKAASATGGKVVLEPMSVPTVGRMAGVMDPGGAALMAFKAEEGDGPDGQEGPGDFVWIELMTDDPDAMCAWYKGAFGYDAVETMQMESGPYSVLSRDGTGRAGVMGKPEAGMPSYWMPYVAVEDVDATVERAKNNGGQSVMEPIDVPHVGRIGLILDPQGAPLGLLKPAMQSEESC